MKVITNKTPIILTLRNAKLVLYERVATSQVPRAKLILYALFRMKLLPPR
jgi:hypothetical protein